MCPPCMAGRERRRTERVGAGGWGVGGVGMEGETAGERDLQDALAIVGGVHTGQPKR